MWTRKPDALSCATASFCERLVTVGTIEVFGPLETLSLIVVPGGWDVPGPGSSPTTVFLGSLASTSTRATAKPFASSVEFALSKLKPITFGTAIGFGPFETRSVTRDPSSTDGFLAKAIVGATLLTVTLKELASNAPSLSVTFTVTV